MFCIRIEFSFVAKQVNIQEYQELKTQKQIDLRFSCFPGPRPIYALSGSIFMTSQTLNLVRTFVQKGMFEIFSLQLNLRYLVSSRTEPSVFKNRII